VSQDEIPLRVYDDYEYNTFYNVPKEELYITKYVDFPSLRRNADISDEEFKKRKLEFQDTIKTHIMNYGSIFAAIYATDNPNHYIGEKSNDKNKLLDHTISIVGWDDNYSKENFKTPEGYKWDGEHQHADFKNFNQKLVDKYGFSFPDSSLVFDDKKSDALSFVRTYLSSHNLEYVDMSSQGGSLYFFDEKAAEALKAAGLGILYAAQGSRSTKHRPAWYLKLGGTTP